jgi:hypothetical protein
MNQLPRIEQLLGKKLIGKHLRMSLVDNKTGDLRRSFIPDSEEEIWIPIEVKHA